MCKKKVNFSRASSSGCVPDLTPSITVIPNAGISGPVTMYMKIDIKEVLGCDIDNTQTAIFKVPRNYDFNFTYVEEATTIFVWSGLDNGKWDFVQSATSWTWTLKPGETILANEISSIAVQGTFDAGASSGSTNFTVNIINGSGGETNFSNNSDSETISYSSS